MPYHARGSHQGITCPSPHRRFAACATPWTKHCFLTHGARPINTPDCLSFIFLPDYQGVWHFFPNSTRKTARGSPLDGRMEKLKLYFVHTNTVCILYIVYILCMYILFLRLLNANVLQRNKIRLVALHLGLDPASQNPSSNIGSKVSRPSPRRNAPHAPSWSFGTPRPVGATNDHTGHHRLPKDHQVTKG